MTRDLYWDSLKFVLIFLVIYGHTIDGHTPDGSFNRAMYSFIYMFHMPLFIFISGRFSHIRDKKKYIKGILRLFETYVVSQIILTAISVIYGDNFTINYLTTPNYVLWYLVALIYWRLIVYFFPLKWLRFRFLLIILSLIISILAGFIPISRPFSIQTALAFMPFFVIGYFSVDINIRKYINMVPWGISFIIFFSAFLLLYFIFNRDLSFMHHCAFPYWIDSLEHTIMSIGARCLFIFTATVLGAMLMRLVPTVEIMSKWGSKTLFIYIFHSIIIKGGVSPLITLGYIPQNEGFLFVYTIIITCGLLYLSKIKLFNIMLNPISYCCNKKQEPQRQHKK
jgi:fucose 4-O-acetylase-like acetyltransferase